MSMQTLPTMRSASQQQINQDQNVLLIPPHSIEAEQSVLGAFFLDNNAFDKVQSILIEEDFYRYDHRLIFRAIAEIKAKNQPIDLIILSEHLNAQGNLDDAGGFAYLGTIAKDTPSAANVVGYAEMVRERSHRRQLIGLAQDLKDLAFGGHKGDAAELYQIAEQKMFDLVDNTSSSEIVIHRMKPSLKAVLKHMQVLSKKGGEDALLGTTTGFSELNDILSGFVPGDLILVGGRPSMGKTALCGDFEIAAARAGKPVLVFSLEMPAEQLIMRYISKLSGTPLDKVRKTWKMEEHDWSKLGNAIQPLNDFPLFIVDSSTVSPSEIRSTARRVQRICKKDYGKPLGLITLDYVGLMQGNAGGNHNDNRANQLGDISRNLKAIAKEFKVPFVVLSQLNRSLEQRINKRPILSDLRESGSLEQDADVVIFVYRDVVYNADTAEKNKAEIIVAKQRNGAIGTVPLVFDGVCTRFRDFAADYYQGNY